MAARCHSAQSLRQAPDLAARLLRPAFEMAFTVAGIAWLFPESAIPAAITALVSMGIPLAAQPMLAERDLRFRNHTGALSRFYLDALLGLTAIRSHGAERSVRREQELLLAEWARSAPDVEPRSQHGARAAVAKGWRWSAEMEEIAATLVALGLPGGFHRTAAEVYATLPRETDDGDPLTQVFEALRAIDARK
jgi:hypothetical protein